MGSNAPGVGESWWLNDMLVLVLELPMPLTVRGIVLLDLDEVFDVGVPIVWRYDDPPQSAAVELDRRIA